MGLTLIEKIISSHSDGPCRPGDIVDMRIDARLARDFGGANVVKNIEEHGLGIDDIRPLQSALEPARIGEEVRMIEHQPCDRNTHPVDPDLVIALIE